VFDCLCDAVIDKNIDDIVTSTTSRPAELFPVSRDVVIAWHIHGC